jgi:phosphatidylserine/phosphatidylglycerophosphate/cardiolipin synthase-like enzyme
MLVDDEFAIVGSANIGMRSMAYDSEVSLGIVDAENEFVRNLRMELWAQHAEIEDPETIVDPKEAVSEFYQSAVDEVGRVRFFPKQAMSVHIPYRFIMNKIIDPYHGPPIKK